MMGSSVPRLMDAIDATWPAAEVLERDGWILRRGEGGGKRVSAASLQAVRGSLPEIDAAAAQMVEWGQVPLFRIALEIGGAEETLDRALADQGYGLVDPVVIYHREVERILDGQDETARIIRVSTPLGVTTEIWAAGGIGAERLHVMRRAGQPRSILMARLGDRPVGVAFVSLDRRIAMIHAIEVLRSFRRKSVGEMLLRGAASFAKEFGASGLALAVTEANVAARRLYDKVGMEVVGRYHYRAAQSAN